jgi:hypothetical protein
MKWLLVFLLLVNGLFFGYTRLVVPPAGMDPLYAELQPQSVKRLAALPPPVPVPDTAAEPASTVATAAPGAVADADTVVAQVEEPAPVPAPAQCWQSDWLPAEMVKPPLVAKVAALSLGSKLDRLEQQTGGQWWVFIPPRASADEATRQAGELSRQGVRDFFVVRDNSKFHLAISLGIFSTADAADKRLEEVKKQGVKLAQVGVRNEGKTSVRWLFNQLDAAQSARLQALANVTPALKITVVPCVQKAKG